jgi:hypothetical protein
MGHIRRLSEPLLHLTLATGLLAASATAAVAMSPRDELLRCVPADIGFCLVLQDMRAHAAQLAESPLIEQLRRSPLGASLRGGGEWAKLIDIEAKVRAQLGVDWTRLHDDILGDAVVFAYRGNRRDKEQGLVLVRARSEEALADFVSKFNKAQKDNGELKELEPRDHKGAEYFRRVEAKAIHYYAIRGPVLVFSADEAMLHEALDLARTAEGTPPLSMRFREGEADKAVLALYVSPRPLDTEIEPGPEAKESARTFAACWKALDSIVFSIHLDRDLRAMVSLRGRAAAVPEPIRRFLVEASRPSDLWRLFPENAFFAMVLRVPAPELFDAIGVLMPPDKRQAMREELDRGLGALLGKDFFKDVLPAIGPDGGLAILPPASDDKNWVPQALLALRVSSGPPGAAIDQALLGAISYGAGWAVFAYNHDHPDKLLAVRSTTIDKQEVKYLVGDKALPAGVQPALALREGYLVLASSLEGLRRFRSSDRVTDPTSGALLWRISFTAFRVYLIERRKDLAGMVADKDSVPLEEAGKRVDAVASALQFLDRAELRLQTAPGQALFTLRLQPTQPLRK